MRLSVWGGNSWWCIIWENNMDVNKIEHCFHLRTSLDEVFLHFSVLVFNICFGLLDFFHAPTVSHNKLITNHWKWQQFTKGSSHLFSYYGLRVGGVKSHFDCFTSWMRIHLGWGVFWNAQPIESNRTKSSVKTRSTLWEQQTRHSSAAPWKLQTDLVA